MTTDRIKEIQSKTAYPDSISVQQALLQVWNECEQEQLRIANVSGSLPNYEYEMLIDDEGTPFEINSWIPITTDRIKDPSRIDEYIAKGLIRKRQ